MHKSKLQMILILFAQTDFKNIRKYENANEISCWALISDSEKLQMFLLK